MVLPNLHSESTMHCLYVMLGVTWEYVVPFIVRCQVELGFCGTQAGRRNFRNIFIIHLDWKLNIYNLN